MMMLIAPNSRAPKEEKKSGVVKGEYGGIWGEEEGDADYGGMMQPNQKHVAPRVKLVMWGFDTRGLGMLAAFWAGILLEVT